MTLHLFVMLLAIQVNTNQVKVDCVTGLRDDPVMAIDNGNKLALIYFSPSTPLSKCEDMKDLITRNKLSLVCGCKHIFTPGRLDRIRLQCATIKEDRIFIKRVAIYYHFPDLLEQCEDLAWTLMKRNELELHMERLR